jgi:hypothetical protein
MGFDPFGSQKRSAFVKSQASVCGMAAEVEALVAQGAAAGVSQAQLKERLFLVMQVGRVKWQCSSTAACWV